jgi:hypothetical protein
VLKFFRKIRHRLLGKGKFRKYLLYAGGEIILVVIGILIALQINNWSERRKERIAERDFYCKLLEDFELDRQNIGRLYKESNYKIETAKKLLLELPQKNKSKEYLIDTYIQALRTNVFAPSRVAILDITSSGNLKLIKRDSLKQNLIRYYAELDNLLYQLELNRTESLERAFSYEDDIAFGFQHADYAKLALGPEVMATLPVNNWQLDPNSQIYMQYQDDLVFFVVMSDREKQHFNKILEEMQPTYRELQQLCEK